MCVCAPAPHPDADGGVHHEQCARPCLRYTSAHTPPRRGAWTGTGRVGLGCGPCRCRAHTTHAPRAPAERPTKFTAGQHLIVHCGFEAPGSCGMARGAASQCAHCDCGKAWGAQGSCGCRARTTHAPLRHLRHGQKMASRKTCLHILSGKIPS